MSAPESQVTDLWERATSSLAAAETLLSNGFWDYAASRAYYAAFYAASALLAAEGKRFSSHRAVLSHIHKDYVKQGRLSHEMGRTISSLFDLRFVGDCGVGLHVAPPRAEQAVADAGRFLDAVRARLPQSP